MHFPFSILKKLSRCCCATTAIFLRSQASSRDRLFSQSRSSVFKAVFIRAVCVYIWFIAFEWHRIRTSPCFSARTAFEKMTDVDYQGETYYTIRNLSLYECQVSELQLSTFPMLFRCPKPSYIYSPK